MLKNIVGRLSATLSKAVNPEAYAARQEAAKQASMLKALPATSYSRLTDEDVNTMGLKKGGKVKVSSASKRADGCAKRGKTRGKIV